MSMVLNYQLSVFGSFKITPKPETITELMPKMNLHPDIMLLPNVVTGQQIEIPTNNITITSNLNFVSTKQQYVVSITDERIDVNYNRVNDEEINIEQFYSFAISILTVLLDFTGTKATRLAVNIQYVYNFSSFPLMHDFGKKVIKEVPYYSDKELSEWSIRLNSESEIKIGEYDEMVNVITDVNSAQDITGKKPAVLFHIDINTSPKNSTSRFDSVSLKSFVDNALERASEIYTGVEGLLRDE